MTGRDGRETGARRVRGGAVWFPGEMARTRHLIRENLSLTTLVIEVADARAPRASRYPGLAPLVPGRPILTVLAKADLADPEITRDWVARLEAGTREAVARGPGDAASGGAIALSAGNRADVQRLVRKVTALGRRAGRRGPIRAMIVGLPNVGKSTLINRLAGRASARTGDRPGITRGKQWIRTGSGFDLCDLPGILVPGRLPSRVALLLAVLGVLPEQAFDTTEAARLVLDVLAERDALPAELKVAEEEPPGRAGGAGAPDGDTLLARYALARGHLRSGGRPDLERAATSLVRAFREGRFGRVSLETPAALGPEGGPAG